jgi:hypothetical protein
MGKEIQKTSEIPILLKLPGQELQIHPEAKSMMLQRTASGSWDLQEVAKMGDSDIFVKRDATGAVRLTYKKVRLTVAAKEIARVGKNWIPTVPGYNKLNQVAGINPINPPSIIVNGAENSNPYVEYNPAGDIKRVIARKIAIGYSPIGNLVAIDTTRHYNFDAYFLQDLQAKASGDGTYARFGMEQICSLEEEAKVQTKDGKTFAYGKKPYAFQPIKDFVGIWMDVSHREIIDVYKQHIRHQMFGETIAQNIAWRNALKAHPAIATASITVSGKEGEEVAEVLVYGYRHEMDRTQYESIASDIVNGREVKGAEVRQDIEEVEATEVNEETESAQDETAAKETREPAASKPAQTIGDLRMKIATAAGEKDLDLNEMSKRLFASKFGALTAEQLEKLLPVVLSTTPGKKKDGAA